MAKKTKRPASWARANAVLNEQSGREKPRNASIGQNLNVSDRKKNCERETKKSPLAVMA